MDDIAKEDTGATGETTRNIEVVPPITTDATSTAVTTMETSTKVDEVITTLPETNDTATTRTTTTTTTTKTADTATTSAVATKTVQDDSDMKIDDPATDEAKTGENLKVEEEEKDVEETTEEKGKEDAPKNVKETKSVESGKKKRKSTTPTAEDETTTTTTTETALTKRSSRDRKSVEVYDPKVYDKSDKSIQVIDGRGIALKSIPQCRESIENNTVSVDDVQMAFKFVFGSKYKLPSKKEMVQHLLDFNGYLPKKDTSMSKDEQEKADDELEGKFGARAYKLAIPALKKMCDFFMIDRFQKTTKDALVDTLLDFLGTPQKIKVKGGNKSSSGNTTTKKSTNKKAKTVKRAKAVKKNDEGDDDEDDDDDEDEEMDDEEPANENVNGDDDDGYDDIDDDKIQQNTGDDGNVVLPTKETLRKWVRVYVRCFHENKLTVNHALEIGSEKFGIDLLPMKADLKKLLIEEL